MYVRTLSQRLRRRGLWLFALLIASALALSACDLVGTDDEDEQQQQAQQQEAEQQQAAAATPASRPAAQPPQQPSGPPPPPVARGGGQGELAYSIVFPSVARVSAGDAVATGLVISQGFVLIDGAVLGGAASADVQLSNGDTLEDLPVVRRDALTGLAYLGPVDASLIRLLPGAQLGDGESLRPGSSVFSVGYGASDGADVWPAVFSGVVSSFVEWEPGQRTILRTDISLPLYSGGMVLVDAAGTVIGIAPAAAAGEGMYVSTGDLVRSLAADPPAGSEAAPSVETSTEHTLTLAEGQASVSLFVGDQEPGEQVLVTVRTETASTLTLYDGAGELHQEANLVSGTTIVALARGTVGPNEIVIAPAAAMEGMQDDEAGEAMPEPATYEVSANVPLMALAEAEDMAELSLDEPLVGSIDLAGDVDTFTLAVRAGAVYEVLLQSFLMDSYLMVAGAGIDAADDDSGGGLFDLDSVLTIEPALDGVVQVTVSDRFNSRSGTYLLTVTQVGGPPAADPDAEAAMDDEEDDSMMMAALLPAPSPPPTISLRGIGGDDGLRATLVGLNSQSVGNGLLVVDADGAFEIIVSVIGVDGSLGRLTVTNASGEVVVEGRVLVSCPGSGQCLAQAVFVGNEAEGGPWIVELGADEPGISEWQIEVERHE